MDQFTVVKKKKKDRAVIVGELVETNKAAK